MKKLLLLLSILCGLSASAQFRCQELKQTYRSQSTPSVNNNGKSDTIDIKHYHLYLDLTAVSSGQIKGRTRIYFESRQNNVTSLPLDLLELDVDSINLLLSGTNYPDYQNYTYNDSLLSIDFPNALSLADSGMIEIFYQGFPLTDASGWGGFHAQNGYYYNLGVGFAADPHTFGRAWFPCFDNFVEKSTYELEVLSVEPLLPLLSGDTITRTPVGTDSVVSSSALLQPIPTYLVSFALADYEFLQDTVQAMQGTKDILLAAKQADTANLRSSFRNLKPVLHSFERSFGPYLWPRIGYAMTTVGAMEHATSIHFPISLVNGTLSGEDIMAHELAHHWWGNLVTCETAEDMWINEGMAEYCSFLYAEDVFGYEEYIDRVQENAYRVLNEAHTRDNGYRAVYGLPHDLVYGFHVYQKGAMVVHNLRAYLGDNLFFSGLTQLLQQNRFGNLNTLQFRDQLSQITSVNLNSFFNDWILNPGFAQFSVDSLYTDPTSGHTAVVVSQRLHQAPSLFTGVPVDITFFSPSGDTATRTVTVSNTSQNFTFSGLSFQPSFALATYSGKLLAATTWDEYRISGSQTYDGNRSRLRVSADNVSDSLVLIAAYHWTGPGGDISGSSSYRISNSEYWTVQGIDLQNGDLKGRISYGANSVGSDLTGSGADSLFLLYRPFGWSSWSPYPFQDKTAINASIGFIEFDLSPGDYVLGNIEPDFSLNKLPLSKGKIDIYPNPARHSIKILFTDYPQTEVSINIITIKGQLLYQNKEQIKDKSQEVEIELGNIVSQNIIVKINDQSYPVTIINP